MKRIAALLINERPKVNRTKPWAPTFAYQNNLSGMSVNASPPPVHNIFISLPGKNTDMKANEHQTGARIPWIIEANYGSRVSKIIFPTLGWSDSFGAWVLLYSYSAKMSLLRMSSQWCTYNPTLLAIGTANLMYSIARVAAGFRAWIANSSILFSYYLKM